MKRLLTLFLLILLSFSAFAQKQRPQEEQLGIQYFQNAEYDKAAQMFEKVYNSNPNSYIYYYYYQTLLQLGDFKEAEKIVKKQQRLSPKTQRYKIDLGYVYETSGNKAAADKADDVEFRQAVLRIGEGLRTQDTEIAAGFIQVLRLIHRLPPHSRVCTPVFSTTA